MKLFNYDTLFQVMEFVEDATDRFCEQEKNRYNNNIDVQAILPEKCYKKIYSKEDQADRYKGYVTSPIRILYTFGNVEEVKEYSITPLCENEEFIAAVENFLNESNKNGKYNWVNMSASQMKHSASFLAKNSNLPLKKKESSTKNSQWQFNQLHITHYALIIKHRVSEG